MMQIRCSYHDGTKAHHIQEIGELAEWKILAQKVVHGFMPQQTLE